RRCPSSHKWIEHRVANETEHPNEPFSQLRRVRRRMVLRRGAGQSGPYLLKPFLVVLRGEQAQHFRGNVWRPVSARLSLHQYELNVVLDYPVWFIGLS